MAEHRYNINTIQRAELFRDIKRRSDRIVAWFMIGSFLFGLLIAGFYDTWLVAVGVGGT